MPLAQTNSYVDVDGVYVKVSARLQPLVSLLMSGASEEDLRREIDTIKPGQNFTTRQLRDFLDKLFSAHALRLEDTVGTTGVWRLQSVHSSKKPAGLESAIRCRVTLLPEAAANHTARFFQGFYSRSGSLFTACFLLVAATVYLHRFGGHSLSFNVLFQSVRDASSLSLAIAAVAIIFSSVFHEIGHCSAVAASGLRVGRIGFGIYWLSPALFSDVSAAWTLSRRQRVAVDSGGIYFQLILCGVLATSATITSSAEVQFAFQIAIVVNIVTIISALNPVMKCDGYWIVSDALGLPNLRRQSERAMGDFVRSRFRSKGQRSAPVSHSKFLFGYGLVSLLFSAVVLVAFAIVIRQNAGAALFFPQELWTFLTSTGNSARAGGEMARLGVDFLRVLPVLFAPIAFMTAVSGMAGFLGRAFEIIDPER